MAKKNSKSGFTLVELAVVIVIIGILATFAVPKFRAAVERSKAGEAFNYLAAVRSAQERYHNRQGTYANDLNELDIKMQTPLYFQVGAIADNGGNIEEGWKLTLTRKGASAGYGSYTVIFTDEGFDTTSDIANNATLSKDINPMSTAQ